MSLLTLRYRDYCPLYLDFHGQSLKVIDRNGKPWFTAETVGKALEFADPRRSVRRLYDRNKDEFTREETAVIEMEIEVSQNVQRRQIADAVRRNEMEIEAWTDDYRSQFADSSEAGADDYRGQFDPGSQAEDQISYPQSGGRNSDEQRGQFDHAVHRNRSAHTKKQKVRIFSLRGCYLLGMLAKTEVGRRFRAWALDLIEHRHEETGWYAAYRDVVKALCDKHPAWERIHFKFMTGTAIKKIAVELNLHPSTVSRALRQMRQYKLLTDAEYKKGRAEGRAMQACLRRIRKESQTDMFARAF